jgi:hypothetical protein
MTIDTLEYVKKLEAAGVDRKAAEAHAEALRASIEDELATKTDIVRLEASMKAEIHRLEAKIFEFKTDLEGKLADFRTEMMKYMIAQTFLIVGVVFALLRFVR